MQEFKRTKTKKTLNHVNSVQSQTVTPLNPMPTDADSHRAEGPLTKRDVSGDIGTATLGRF